MAGQRFEPGSLALGLLREQELELQWPWSQPAAGAEVERGCPGQLGAAGAHAQREQSPFFSVQQAYEGDARLTRGVSRDVGHLSWFTPACLEAQSLSWAFGRCSGQGGGSVLGWEVSGADAVRAAASE